jgi:hypothetical protein
MSTMEKLIRKYDVNLAAFMELNFNWSKVNSSANLTSWLHQEERETRSIRAHNTQEQDDLFSKHQPGGIWAWSVEASTFNMRASRQSIQEVSAIGAHGHSTVIPTTCQE